MGRSVGVDGQSADTPMGAPIDASAGTSADFPADLPIDAPMDASMGVPGKEWTDSFISLGRWHTYIHDCKKFANEHCLFNNNIQTHGNGTNFLIDINNKIDNLTNNLSINCLFWNYFLQKNALNTFFESYAFTKIINLNNSITNLTLLQIIT